MGIQAFIFCGKGRHLWPFSQEDLEHGVHTGLPKALLPVGNRAMIEYVLDFCDQADFSEINVVASPEEVDIIRDGLVQFLSIREQQFDMVSKSLSQSSHAHHIHRPPTVTFITSASSCTGETLQKDLLAKITGDFVLLPCDFITDIPPQILINQFDNRDSENLAMAIYYKNSFENIDKKQTGKQFYTVYSSNEDNDQQPVLLDIYSKDDVAKTKDLQIRTHLLWRYPNSTVSTKLVNSFIYFCSYDLCKLLQQDDAPNEFFSSNSFADSDHEGDNKNAPQDLTEIKPTYFKKSNELIKDPLNCNKSLAKVFRDLGRRSWQHSEKRETIALFILPEVSSFIRSNNLNAYMEANRFLLKIKAQTVAKQGQTTIGNSSAIGVDAIVGNNCIIQEKSNIKMSAVGHGCKIGKRCKIVGSILLDNVELEDEVILENVIIGVNGHVGKRSKLTNTYVEGNYVVAPKTTLKGETLTKMYFESAEDETDTEDDEISGSTSESDYDEEGYEDEDEEDDGLFER